MEPTRILFGLSSRMTFSMTGQMIKFSFPTGMTQLIWCAEIAVALNQPLEVISLKMVFRACAHFAQALLTKPAIDWGSY